MKKFCLHNVDILVKQMMYRNFKMTFEVKRQFMKNMRLLNVSIHRNFIKSGLYLNVLERKKLKSQSFTVFCEI